ncbi:ATP-binding protein [Desulfonatronum thioautotrophicum]|uniref:ATP-binding protein n=1 Tax=Desulfonatronum thioautotrophicum TaxID=617001 RepID=UPI00069B078A|nr:ATP-binding protein [Desulfonatronum thioautotrophicum]
MPPRSDAELVGLSLPATPPSLEPLRHFVLEHFQSTGLNPALALKIDLVLEEVLLNIFTYAYTPDRPGMVTVECGSQADKGGFLIRFSDQGPPFDPLSQTLPDVTLDMDERTQGGLGILLAREMSSFQEYRREGESNILDVYFVA